MRIGFGCSGRVATDGKSRVLINPTAMIGACEIDKNAKLLLTLIYKNDFWVQRVAKDEGSRVLINPTALLGACEIDKTE